jgi:1,4-dihydroxy-2-naphthoate octaprenyltransferase
MQLLSRNNLIALWGMARPLLLLVVIPIYLIGNLIARVFGYPWDTPRFFWGLLALLPVVLAAHYANEYVDFETDALTKRTPFSGGSGSLARGLGSRHMALGATWVMLAIGLLMAGISFANDALSGSAIFLWGVGTLVGLTYSLPPFKLAWRGWSEAINALIIGLLLPLYGYTAQTGRIDWQIIVGCAPFALLIFVLILSTNWADRDADRQVGKFTLSARLTPVQLRRLYIGAAFLGFALQPLMIGWILPVEVVLSSLPAVPVLAWAATRYTRTLSPLPTVLAMLVLLPLQMGAWIMAGG